MRLFAYILFSAVFAIGCNADPRCRRETALLRAEIIDLEDKLALATAGYSYEDSVISTSDGIIVSDQIISSEPVIYSSEPLQVQHQIFPTDAAPSSAASRLDASTTAPEEIQIEMPRLPDADLESILPSNPTDSILDTPTAPTLPATDSPRGSSSKNTKKRRRTSTPEIEITLDEPASENQPLRSAQRKRPTVVQTASPRILITEISVNRDASRGKNIDGQPGDEGLDLLIQPRTDNGTIVLEPGELSVDLIDPAAPKGDQIVGHWHFLPSETQLFFARDRRDGKGILLHLPWEQNLPTHEDLSVAVTFTTSDGRMLTTNSRLRVDPPQANYEPTDPLVTGWTQRDTRWQIGTHNQASTDQNRSWQESTQPRATPRDRHVTSPQDLSAPGLGPRKRTIKAIPASSSKPVVDRPRWRPVR